MIFDPDHMSVLGRNQALNLVESQGLLGDRLLAQLEHRRRAAADLRARRHGHPLRRRTPTGFVDEWRHLRDCYRQAGTQYFGVGYGADMNGFGAQGPPRGADVAESGQLPVQARSTARPRSRQQRSGERVYDINADGVAHYGLYPDWIEDLRMQAGDRIVRDMGRGAEAYLQMWERAERDRGGALRPLAPALPHPPRDRAAAAARRPAEAGAEARRPAGEPDAHLALVRERPQAGEGAGDEGGQEAGGRGLRQRGRGRPDRQRPCASSAPRACGPGCRSSDLRERAERFGGLWVRDAGNGRKFAYGVRKGRIAIRRRRLSGAAASPATLKRYLRRAHIR